MADVQVRPARLNDTAEISRIQATTWHTAYSQLLPLPVLEAATGDALSPAWAKAIQQPPSTAHRILLAMEKNQKVGFIAAAPANPDNTTLSTLDKTPPNTIEIGPLLVEPRWGRRGHGSRLLTAAIELAKADGATYALTWLLHGDTASRAFFESAGWEIDGSSRELDMPGRLVREIRLHTDLSEVPIQENNK